MLRQASFKTGFASLLILVSLLQGSKALSAPKPEYTSDFMLEECGGFSVNGQNPFFILEPGYILTLAGIENGADTRLTINVLNKTKMVAGTKTRIVEERQTEDGQLVEVSRNYYAICNRNNSVVYFGEDVDIYKNGTIINHKGSWLAGRRGAKPGVFMPGIVLLGARYYQEIAPRVALDRAEIVSLNDVVQTPAGQFKKSLKTKETTPLEPKFTGFKWYAPGIGLIQDGTLKLVEIPAKPRITPRQ